MKVVFLGPPGSGKGTYSTRLAKELDIPHISTGEIFREIAKQDSELGKKVSEIMKKGDYVPDDITIEILKERISRADCKNGFILDGYPRTIEQAEALDKISKIDVVIDLKIAEEVLIQKLSARRVCPKCEEIYNIAYIKGTYDGVEYNMPPMNPKKEGICDKCGGELIQRKDDTVEAIRERLEVYKEQTEPLIKYYRDRGLIKDVIVNDTPEIMVPKIMEILKEI